MKVNMHEAKSQLSKLGEKAWQGERIVIAKAGKPYLDLIPHNPQSEIRTPGKYANEIVISDDFDNLDPEIQESFEADL